MSAKIIILSGPSRGGKDTVANALHTAFGSKLHHVTTYTTRPKRQDEIEGQHHFFVSKPVFRTMIKRGAFLEWAHVRNNYFGTPVESVKKTLGKGMSVLLKIEVQGAAIVKKQFPHDTIRIFLKPGSIRDIRERINASDFTPAQKKVRFKEALREMKASKQYDYIIINKKGALDKTVEDGIALIARLLHVKPKRLTRSKKVSRI